MKDTIEFKDGKIVAKLSVTIEEKDDSFVGYIPAFDIPFTSPTQDKAAEIAKGLVSALFKLWLKNGEVDHLIDKLKKYKFSLDKNLRDYRSEYSGSAKTMRIKEELYVA